MSRRSWLITGVVLIAIFVNPTGSAHFVHEVVAAGQAFVSGIGW